ncbi:MAG: hypothetical protein AAB403_11220 [Planctomycetota bacterium]
MAETRFPGYTGARLAVLDLLRPHQGKTLDAFWIEDEPRAYQDRHHSERLRLRFTDGSEVSIQIGTNLNTLGNQGQGYHLKSADQLSAWFYVA